MRLRTTMQLASFFPIFLAALFVVGLFTVHLTSGSADDDGSALSVAVATVMGVLSLLAGWGFYHRGHRLAAQLDALEGMAERVRRGDLTPAERVADEAGDGVSTVTKVFSELVVELHGYVTLIREHETLKQELQGATATADRLREASVRVSGTLERLRRAEEGLMDYLIQEDRYLLTWLTPKMLGEALVLPPAPGARMPDVAVPPDVASLVRALVMPSADLDVAETASCTVSVQEALTTAMHLCEWAWTAREPAVEIALDALSDGPFDICAERSALVQVFVAVLQNGAEAMPEGGTIRIEMDGDGRGTVSVTISDPGSGMSEAVRARCMEPFFSTREGHLGVGLALATQLMGRWSGRLGVIGEPGQGTSVHMTFARPPRKEVATPGEVRLHEPLQVLLVEDDVATRETLTQLLVHEQHKVTAVEDGAAAILELRERVFDVVLTDRAMPIMTGDELAVAVKARRAETAVVMVTGMGEAMQRQHQRPPGVDVLISKPVRRDDLKVGLAHAMACVAVD